METPRTADNNTKRKQFNSTAGSWTNTEKGSRSESEMPHHWKEEENVERSRSLHRTFEKMFPHRLDDGGNCSLPSSPFFPSYRFLLFILAAHVSCNNNSECAPAPPPSLPLPFIASAIKMRRIAEIPEVPSGEGCEFCARGRAEPTEGGSGG